MFHLHNVIRSNYKFYALYLFSKRSAFAVCCRHSAKNSQETQECLSQTPVEQLTNVTTKVQNVPSTTESSNDEVKKYKKKLLEHNCLLKRE